MSCDYEFELPIYLIFKYKTKKPKKVAVNINWYRNAHHIELNNAKKMYSELMKEQISSFEPLQEGVKIRVHYQYYSARNNNPDLDNFVSAAKKFFQDAMVNHGFIPDDNVNVIYKNSEEYRGVDKENPRVVARVYVD